MNPASYLNGHPIPDALQHALQALGREQDVFILLTHITGRRWAALDGQPSGAAFTEYLCSTRIPLTADCGAIISTAAPLTEEQRDHLKHKLIALLP